MGWLEDVAGPNFAPAVLWTLLALVILVIVLIIIRIVRSMTFGTFVAGGRNRKTRLAVMDAAAVDSQRRLVLVRRDDVEHLILIGGPTDVVVERDIRLHSPIRRPAPPAEPVAEAPARGRPEVTPRGEPARPPAGPTRPEQPAQQPAYRAPQPAAPPPAAKPAPVRTPPSISTATSEQAYPASRPSQPPGGTQPVAPRLKPLDAGKSPGSDATDANRRTPKPPELSLEEEMNRLLGELSTKK
jgi:hypothetical protein